MMFVQRRILKTALNLSPNGKSVLQSTSPTFMNVFFEKEEKLHILNPWFVSHIHVFIGPA